MPTAARATRAKSATATTVDATSAGTATLPKASTSSVAARSNGATATMSSSVQATQHALAEFQQLQQTISQLGSELNSYNDPNLIGRNPVLLKSFFDQVTARCMQIAWAYKFNWTPPNDFPRNGRGGK